MKVVGLISGGKDSVYNLMQCRAAGHDIVALANIKLANNPLSIRTDDGSNKSYMYQFVGNEAVSLIANAMNLPLFLQITQGVAIEKGLSYAAGNDGDEVEDIFHVLTRVKCEIPDVEGVSVGAILSDYQRVRVENICSRLRLSPLAYLWQRDQYELLHEMLDAKVDAILIKVATLGLDPQKHLGRSLASLSSYLVELHEKYGINICGEGGEYETLVVDCPLYTHGRITIDKYEIIMEDTQIAPVGFLKLTDLHLETQIRSDFSMLRIKSSNDYVCEFIEEDLSATVPLNSVSNLSICGNQNETSALNVNTFNDEWLWIGGLSSNDSTGMETIMSRLDASLRKWNHSLSNVCQICLYVPDLSIFSQFNTIYKRMFDASSNSAPPTRVCVEACLSDNSYVLSAISWKQKSEAINISSKRYTVNVTSRSHWAPACIGPYSQLMQIEDVIYLAGQIGLIPGCMQLIQTDSVKAQCRLTLRHIHRLLLKSVPGIKDKLFCNTNKTYESLNHVLQAICYVTDIQNMEIVQFCWHERCPVETNALVEYVVVRKLPNNALVEWQVLAHMKNSSFQYKHYEQVFGSDKTLKVTLRIRYNAETNTPVAFTCSIEKSAKSNTLLTATAFFEILRFLQTTLSKTDRNIVMNLTIFYSVITCSEIDYNNLLNVSLSASKLDNVNFVHTLIPVVYVKNCLCLCSICGVCTSG